MKCPECVKEGLRSRVYGGNGETTLMGGSTFYDEDGIHHTHDPNTTYLHYRCSNEHKWTVTKKRRCGSCDYNWKT